MWEVREGLECETHRSFVDLSGARRLLLYYFSGKEMLTVHCGMTFSIYNYMTLVMLSVTDSIASQTNEATSGILNRYDDVTALIIRWHSEYTSFFRHEYFGIRIADPLYEHIDIAYRPAAGPLRAVSPP